MNRCSYVILTQGPVYVKERVINSRGLFLIHPSLPHFCHNFLLEWFPWRSDGNRLLIRSGSIKYYKILLGEVFILERYVLVADDNEDIVDILSTYLLKEGFRPIQSFDGEDAILKCRQYNPVILLLDVMMPGKSGFDVCREIRKERKTPIIMITAKSEDVDKIMGLEIGADDYVVKPFSPGEVMARIKAVLRRMDLGDTSKPTVLTYPQLVIDIENYEVTIDSKAAILTKKEIEILWLLAGNPNRVFTRDNILNSIWGYDYYGDSRSVDTHMKRLRAKLDLKGQYSWDVKTIWGVGYKFEVKHDSL